MTLIEVQTVRSAWGLRPRVRGWMVLDGPHGLCHVKGCTQQATSYQNAVPILPQFRHLYRPAGVPEQTFTTALLCDWHAGDNVFATEPQQMVEGIS